MSYFRSAGKGLRQDKMAKSLGSTMSQGDQPKHSNDYTDLTEAMGQGEGGHRSKGSACKSLGATMGQGSGKNGH